MSRSDRSVRSRAARLLRVALASVLVWGCATVATPVTGAAATEDGTVTVQVLRDFFGTGVLNPTMDTPQRGMTVTVTDTAGHRLLSVTDATGKVVVPPSASLAGGQYRVDVSIPKPYSDYLRPAPAATEAAHEDHFDSFTSFVDVRGGKDAAVITGVWNPNDYTLPDSRYFVPVQTRSGAGRPTDRALVAFPRDSRGACSSASCPVLDTQAQVGSTWGLAYDKYRGRLFQSAFAKRYTAFGPGGGGAIYTTPAEGTTPAAQLFATVPGATVTQHDPIQPIKDAPYVDAPGKEGIGGLAMTEDGKTLYAVNLLSRRLVSFDATGPGALLPARSVPIPDPGCAAASDWRPFALTAHDARLYVGGVCSAESTQKPGDLQAVVYAYDGSTFSTVLTHTLAYPRGYVAGSGGAGHPQTGRWNPWNADLANWDQFNIGSNVYVDPQPELASLAFTRTGSMILGFRDRYADVVGAGGLDPRPGNNTAEQSLSGGDITMVCARPTGGYDWEGSGACPNHGTYDNNGNEAAGVVEYFHGDFVTPGGHEEASQGSVAYIPQQQYAVSTHMDPIVRSFTDGVGFYDVDDGTGPGNASARGFEIVNADDPGFSKAGGLGDVAYTAANAPIQIGNIVWFDQDHNGIQDAYSRSEVPLAGATVNLLDAGGNQVATTNTDAAGEYYFGGVGADYELTRAAKYTVQFDVCTAQTDNVPGTPPATDLRFTTPTAGNNRAHDSNVVPPTTGRLCNGDAPVTAPAEAGGVDHTIDAGVYIPHPMPPVHHPRQPHQPGGVPVHTGGSASAQPAGTSGNWWWLALGGLGVLLSIGAAVRMVRPRT